MILTHLSNEQLRCSGCGGYLDETTDPAKVTVVHDDTVCHKCAALAAHREALEKTHQDKPGLLLWAETRDPDPDP